MKNKNFETRYIALIILFILTIFLIIFSLTINEDRKLTPIEKVIKDTVIFTQKVLYSPFKYIGDKINQYNEMKDIYDEYKIIKRNLDKYELIKTENIALKDEINNLRDLLDMKNILTDYKYLNATVINRNVGYWYNTITIDKGSTSGIKNDMAVITAQGLIGKTEKVTSFSSEIKLITMKDPKDKISVIINSNNKTSYGLISNYDEKNNNLIIDGIYSNNKIEIGARVYTSGLGDIFPQGILVGKVKESISDQYDLSKKILVEPTANFNDIKFVTILRRKDKNEN
jgi:rod shape-determining protein MreC